MATTAKTTIKTPVIEAYRARFIQEIGGFEISIAPNIEDGHVRNFEGGTIADLANPQSTSQFSYNIDTREVSSSGVNLAKLTAIETAIANIEAFAAQNIASLTPKPTTNE